MVSGLASAAASCADKFGARGPDPELPSPGPRPDYGPTVQQANAPPPIAGGTLLVARDGHAAVAADPDRDRIDVVDLSERAVTHLALAEGDEPGRSIEDSNRRVHVVLRHGGAIVTVDLGTRAIIARRDVCAAPRGIDYDKRNDQLIVACAGGELVTLPAGRGPATLVRRLEPDLRDVVVTPTAILVSLFRTARVLVLDDATYGGRGDVKSPDVRMLATGTNAQAEVAWRMLFVPRTGDTLMVHQRARDPMATPVPVSSGGYTAGGGGGGGPSGGDAGRKEPVPEPPVVRCDLGIVHASATRFPATACDRSGRRACPPESGIIVPFRAFPRLVLPVDVAVTGDGQRLVVVGAGNGKTHELEQLMVVNSADRPAGDCVEPSVVLKQPKGQAIAATYDGGNRLFVQTREPATLVMYEAGGVDPSTPIVLADDSREDTGHTIFHTNSGGFLACASCHPEGGDDGRVWSFAELGARRTQNFRGGLGRSGPFHWDGRLKDLGALSAEVLSKRMSGPKLDEPQLGALSHWINAIPLVPVSAAVDPDAAARGRVVFENPQVGCTSCHTGARRTNDAVVDVGSGGSFKVPSLRGVAVRAPYMHNGCANTLFARFTPECGGARHGTTGALSPVQLDDLVAFLETL